MKKCINVEFYSRAKEVGNYIIEKEAAVRGDAKALGMSKSTVHKDVTERLREINPPLYDDVRRVLDKNKKERHIRGGEVTTKKYLMKEKIYDKW